MPVYFIIQQSFLYGGAEQVYAGEGHLNVPRGCTILETSQYSWMRSN